MKEIRDKTYEEKVVEIKRVSRTVKGGKRISFRALVIVGDKNGKVGLGTGKAAEVSVAIKKANNQARKKLHLIRINEKGTILKEVLYRYGSTKIILRPAPEGTSIIAGGVIRTVAELAGVKNLVTKSIGSNNKLNMAKAAIFGLLKAGENV
ncbi:MAG: 30S ribosomal protein S5 [Candidatus Berkelbacteria bacterium]|nr:30S ribosomal protein S5 [Candidatus Berkelbacteria bacterium]